MKNVTKKRTFSKKDYQSGDGMLTTVWGPSMWHYLHTMSFNYPVNPTDSDKKHYRDFINNLRYVLPCRYCRDNLKKNLIIMPLTNEVMQDRNSFSRYIYNLHEMVNKLLGKKSGLTFCEVRERYENFRSRCTQDKPKIIDIKKALKLKEKNQKKTLKKEKEKGCTEPLYGKKAKCVIKIVPHDEKCKTMQIDKKCIKSREYKSMEYKSIE